MLYPQTVSPEMADRDFGRNLGLRRAVLASLAMPRRAKARKLPGYLQKSRKFLKEQDWLAGEPGFEPGLTESESVGLPLTYSPNRPRDWFRNQQHYQCCMALERRPLRVTVV